MRNQPNKEITLLREQQVWDLRVRCYSQQQIAQQLGISQPAVSQILNRVRDRLTRQYLDGALQMRIDQTEQLLKIAQEAYADYEASKQETNKQAANNPETSPPPPQPGKPAHLRVMLQALAAIRALWGLEAAEKARIAEPQQSIKMLIGIDYDSLKNQDGVPVPRKEFEKLEAAGLV